jgi:hypothetical protein
MEFSAVYVAQRIHPSIHQSLVIPGRQKEKEKKKDGDSVTTYPPFLSFLPSFNNGSNYCRRGICLGDCGCICAVHIVGTFA